MPKKSGKKNNVQDDDDVIMSNSNSNDEQPTTQTPTAAASSTDGKTPVSSGGMIMRSGKKKRRNKSNNNNNNAQKKSAAFTATTPSRKRAAANNNKNNNNNKRSATDDATETGGGARKRRKTKGGTAVDEENEEDEGGSDDDVEMDDSHDNNGVVTATVTKVRFETTKEAVAAAQLAESDDDDDDEEEDDDDSDVDNEQEETEAAAAAAANAPQEVTGWRRLLTQHLRLPYQHTPAAVTAPSPGGPIPAGGRRLIFDTGVKNKENNSSDNNNNNNDGSTTTTGAKSRNKLLMQTRTTTGGGGGGNVATMTSNQTTSSSRKVNGISKKTSEQQQQQRPASPPTQTLLEELSNDDELKRNFKKYTLGWLALMLFFFLLGNVTNILGDYAWDVREQSSRWITKGNEVVQEDDGIDDYVVEEVVVKVVDPNLLQQAKSILRAQRMNQHDIQMYENATAEIILAMKMLDSVEDQLLKTAPSSSTSSLSSSSSARPSLRSGNTDPVAIMEYIESLVDTQEVVIFSKSYCPYCKATKALFAEMNIKPVVIELDELDNGSFIQEILSQMTGQETVPNVFVKKQHVGGNDDTHELAESGQLHKLLSLSVSDDSLDQVKLDSFNSNIREKQELLELWENVLVDVEAALESLDNGHGSIPNDVNAALRSLSKASMIPYSAMAVDTAQIHIPGEGCEGKDYIIPPSEIDKENIVVDVVGGVDVEALDIASDAPLLPEDAQTAYESLVKFAQSTSEALIGPVGPSVAIQEWAQRLIKEECHKEGVDEPVSIQVESVSDGAKKATSSSPAGTYNARAASKDIDRLLEIEDADRTGKFDYASVIHGARVLRRGPRATSLSLFEGLPLINRVLAYSKLRFYGHPPEVALRPTTALYSPGHCWSFGDDFSSNRARLQTQADGLQGEYATLTVALSQEIIVTEVVIDHAPRGSASNNGNTAIKTFRVIGYEDMGAFGEPWELGSFQYDFKLGLQTFTIPTSIDGTTVPKLKAVSLAVDTNWGAEYSCLYRFRVHGG